MQATSIGIFDSGLGGLTVMRAIRQILPNQSIVYLGDTARVPYGGKSQETVLRYAQENSQFLMEKGIQLLVIACNTASAYALSYLQESLPIPVIGVIEPGAIAGALMTQSKRVGVIATRATVASGRYEEALKQVDPTIQVWSSACPLFVPLVEEGYLSKPATQLIIEDSLAPLLENGIDTLLLGCTHFPLLESQIQTIIGPSIKMVDSASTCARAVASLVSDSSCPGTLQYFVTDDAERFSKLGERFLGKPLGLVRQCSLSQIEQVCESSC